MEEIATSGFLALLGRLDSSHALFLVMYVTGLYALFKLFSVLHKLIAEPIKMFAEHISQHSAFESNLDKKLDDIHKKVNAQTVALARMESKCEAIHK